MDKKLLITHAGISILSLTKTQARLPFPRARRFDELGKQRVRGERAGLELGVELGTQEKRMRAPGKLGYFHQNPVGRGG